MAGMAAQSNILKSVRADDFVEYYMFPKVNTVDDKEQEVVLSKVLKEVEKVVEIYAKDYLWHKDPFKVIPRTSISNSLIYDDETVEYLPSHLYGVSHFGDNIEDEWFMVFLLMQLSREIDGLIVKIHDADGEFLLIEAANYLPLWANPDICENRVYLYQGVIHLIPPKDLENPSNSEIATTEAITIIRQNIIETIASQGIQDSIQNKLAGYPDKIQENFHRVSAYVPVGVAAILKRKPNLIAPAVQAFCNRDPIDMKYCKAMKYFPPENRVKTSIKFTKCLYAMLTHSKYIPDRVTGWNLPPSNSIEFKAHYLGVKIACGFEILISQAKPSDNIEQDKGWHMYFNNLKEKNYFNGLLEHSRDYNNLLNKAKEYYIHHRDSMYYVPAIGQEILELTKKNCREKELRKEVDDLPADDDESWLNITPADLDKLLQEQYGGKKFAKINSNSDATDFTGKISTFLEQISEIDGVEFPNEQLPVRPPRGVKKNCKSKVSFSQGTTCKEEIQTSKYSNKNRIHFNPDEFSSAVQNIMNYVIPEDDSWDNESDSDMSDYAEEKYVNVESYADVKNKMKQYMDEMDKELANTTIGDSFEKQNGDSFEDIEKFKPVDIDMNALKNILESYRSQLGEAGPSSNMLGPMGILLDDETQDLD